MLARHITKEDRVLYSMAKMRLSADVLRSLDAQASAFESEHRAHKIAMEQLASTLPRFTVA